MGPIALSWLMASTPLVFGARRLVFQYPHYTSLLAFVKPMALCE